MDSIRLFVQHLSHSQMLFALPCLVNTSTLNDCFINACHEYRQSTHSVWLFVKPGLHLMWMRTTHAEARQGRMYSTFVYCLAFTEVSNKSYINILNVNSLCSTNSRWISFGFLSNICRTAKCCLPCLGNTSTLNDCFINACLIRVLFAFRCKPGFKHLSHSWMQFVSPQ